MKQVFKKFNFSIVGQNTEFTVINKYMYKLMLIFENVYGNIINPEFKNGCWAWIYDKSNSKFS